MPDRIRNTRGVFVGYAFHLRAVDVLFLKGYLTHVNEESHHLREKFVDGILHVFAAEAVDGTERGSLATAEPHVVNVVLQGILYLAARIDVVHVGVEDYLQQHAWVIRRTAEGLVRTHKFCDVKCVNYATEKANMMRFWNFLAQIRREKFSL